MTFLDGSGTPGHVHNPNAECTSIMLIMLAKLSNNNSLLEFKSILILKTNFKKVSKPELTLVKILSDA